MVHLCVERCGQYRVNVYMGWVGIVIVFLPGIVVFDVFGVGFGGCFEGFEVFLP